MTDRGAASFAVRKKVAHPAAAESAAGTAGLIGFLLAPRTATRLHPDSSPALVPPVSRPAMMSSESALEDHYRNPRNLGDLEAPDAVAIVHNPACGDMLRVAARVEDGRIVEVRFKAYGCAAAIAAASVMTELIEGTSLPEAASLKDEDITEVLGTLPPLKHHAVVLAREGAQQIVARLGEPADR